MELPDQEDCFSPEAVEIQDGRPQFNQGFTVACMESEVN